MRKLCSALALRTGVSTFSTRRCLRRGEPSAPAARSSKVRAWLVMIYAAFGVAMHRELRMRWPTMATSASCKALTKAL